MTSLDELRSTLEQQAGLAPDAAGLVEQAQANASSNATAPSAPDPTQEQVHDDVVEATSFNTGDYCL